MSVQTTVISPSRLRDFALARPVLFTVRLALAAVYIIAGATKLYDVRGFAEIVNMYGIVPIDLLPFVALLLPLVEVVAGVALLAGRDWGLALVTALTVLFLAVLGYAIWSGLSIGDCGCFAPGDIPSGHDDGSALKEAFIRDLLLLAGSLHLYLGRHTRAALHVPHP
ncbi:MauE/DoxX family redox-associated membrane protein [Nitratidesulfovibrio vulgaris]|nr:MauE/DoxX family redox-associated membrane protein [Nitratidesulfovibrio vulgaris]ADP87685.1 methylamine utilization MauE [Nitratidesulfovibrio vulgaris RCH1]